MVNNGMHRGHVTISTNPAENQQVGQLMVRIKYRDVEKTFSGDVEQVWLCLNRFFNEFLPSFDIARRLILNVDLEKLVRESQGIVGLATEGPMLLVSRDKVTDNETLILLLLANYLAHHVGRAPTDAMSKAELQSKLGKDAKIVSTRLGELVKNQTVTRKGSDEYKITTVGLIQIQRDIIPRIRNKMKN